MNKYLVALRVGGLMGMPEITYQDFDIIEANSRDEAQEKYNKIHNCSYFYGACLAEKVDGKITVLNKKVSYEQIEELVKEQTNDLQKRNQMLEAKILDWYAKSKDEKFATHFEIKETSDGRV